MEWPLLALCDERVMCVICVHVCMNEKEVNCSIGYFFFEVFLFIYYWAALGLSCRSHGFSTWDLVP